MKSDLILRCIALFSSCVYYTSSSVDDANQDILDLAEDFLAWLNGTWEWETSDEEDEDE